MKNSDGQEIASNLLLATSVIVAIGSLLFREQAVAIAQTCIVSLLEFSVYLLNMLG